MFIISITLILKVIYTSVTIFFTYFLLILSFKIVITVCIILLFCVTISIKVKKENTSLYYVIKFNAISHNKKKVDLKISSTNKFK